MTSWIIWVCWLPFRVIRRFTTMVLIIAMLLSLTLNVAMLTISGAHAAFSAAISTVGIASVATRETGERLARRKATRNIGNATARKVSSRVQRGAARNIASVGGEALPFLGIAVIAGALTLEVKDACDTAADMAGLEAALASEDDPEKARAEAVEDFDCKKMIREQIPDFDELPTKEELWTSIKSAPGAAYDRARHAGVKVSEVDWSGAAAVGLNRILSWGGSIADLLLGEDEASGE